MGERLAVSGQRAAGSGQQAAGSCRQKYNITPIGSQQYCLLPAARCQLLFISTHHHTH